MPTKLSDTDIISQVLQGDKQSFALLVERHQNFVFSIALRYLKSREDAEEVAQDVFVKAYRSIADFKGTSKLSTWLYTISVTSSITFLRKKRVHFHSLDSEAFKKAFENIGGGIPASAIEQKTKVLMVTEAIQMLTPQDAVILTLFYKGEQSVNEISQILGKDVNAVKVQLHRARIKVKEKMQKYFRAEISELYP